MKNKKFTKETIVNILATREYQQFIKEWLALYDEYFRKNPKPFPQVRKDCEYVLLGGFLKIIYDNCQDYDDYCDLSFYCKQWCRDNVDITIQHIEEEKRELVDG